MWLNWVVILNMLAAGPVVSGAPCLTPYMLHNPLSYGRPVYTSTEYTYDTPDGHFKIHYTLSGTDAVPPDDTSPQNGIPDYVDAVAGAMLDS